MNTIDHGSARASTRQAAPLMASPQPEADCDKIASVLEKVEVGEATPAEVDYLIDHAQDCSPCFSSIDKQRLFIAFVQGNVRQKGVPAALAASIRQSIAQEVSA